MAETKRIVSLDYLRGIAIFMMCLFHVFVNSSSLMKADPFGSIGLIIIFLIVFIFAHFRGFFILISGAANVYSMTKGIKKGIKPEKILKKQVFVGTFLVVFGHLKDTFINQWGIFREYYLAGGFNSENFDWSTEWAEKWQLGYTSEAIQSIGWCMLLTSIIYYSILKFNDIDERKKNAIIMVVIAFIFIYLAEPIQLALADLVGYEIYGGSDPWNVEKQGIEYITMYFIYDIGGAQAPIFPMLAYSLFGGIFGIYLTKEDLKRDFIKKGNLIGIVLILIGAIDFVIRLLVFSYEFDPNFQIHPSWYVLIAIGLQIILMQFSFRLFEFNPKKNAETIKKQTLYIRRWSFFSLTVYSFQILEYIPRAILAEIAPSSNLDKWTQSSFVWVLIFMVLNMMMWEGIIRGWERLKMKGTLEWVLLMTAKRGKGINKDDPLRLQANLYDMEPILFNSE
jgi:hypothetical protein